MTHGFLQASNLDWISAAATRSAPAPMLLGRTWQSSKSPRRRAPVRVLHYVAVHDAGRIINPLLAAGQVHGALAQGIGQALLEYPFR